MDTQERETGPDAARKAMHAALAAASERSKAVAKGSRNSHHDYTYASSEHVMVAARDALEGSGLAVVPTRSDIVQVGTLYVLQRQFELTHSEGASKMCSMSWPLEINKGKTPDKAAAGAETTSYAYFLRTLLRMPRLAGDDMDHDSHEPRHRPQDVSPAVPMLSARAKVALERVAAIDSPEKFRAAETWVSGLLDKVEAGIDTGGLTKTDVHRLMDALEAKR
jgi:hypothetical protein